MGFKENIETISNKKELTEKVDKALTTAQEAKKEAIAVQRIVARQSGNGLPNTTNGNNGAGYSQEVFDSNGDIQTPIAAPPVTQAVISTSSGALTAAAQAYLDRNRLYQDQYVSNNNDLSNNATLQSNSTAAGTGSTRTESKNQADPDNAGDTGWDDYKQALIDNGASQATIDAARQEYWAREPGKYEVSDVYNGDAGPALNFGNWKPTQDERGLLTSVTGAVNTLNALVGVDPDDPSQAIELRLDGKFAIPSIEESLAAGQSVWTDGFTAPLKPGWDLWQLGYQWGDGGVWDTPSQGATARVASLNTPTPLGYSFDNMRVTAVDGGGIPTQYSYDIRLNGVFSSTVNSIRQGAAPGAPTDAEYETAWSVVGLYSMTLKAATWLFSQFDTEVPLKYASGSSTAYIKSAITGDVYAVEPATQGGTMIYNNTNPEYLLYFGQDRTLKDIAPISAYKFFMNKPR